MGIILPMCDEQLKEVADKVIAALGGGRITSLGNHEVQVYNDEKSVTVVVYPNSKKWGYMYRMYWHPTDREHEEFGFTTQAIDYHVPAFCEYQDMLDLLNYHITSLLDALEVVVHEHQEKEKAL